MPNILDRLNGLASVRSAALENSHILITPSTYGFGGPFVLDNLTVFNFDTATAYMVLVFDSATLPADGTVTPVYWAFCPIATAAIPGFVGIDWTQVALKCTDGIVVAGSSVLTTPFTLTVATATKLAFAAQVIA